MGASGVAAGAVGAHLLEEHLAAKQLAQYDTAVRYQLLHALALLLIGALGQIRSSRALSAAGWLFLVGVLLFSGCLYGYVAAVAMPLMRRFLAAFIAIGGSLLILGWLALGVHAVAGQQSKPE